MRQAQNPKKPKSSKYAKKATYLRVHGGFGMDYLNKPWRGEKE